MTISIIHVHDDAKRAVRTEVHAGKIKHVLRIRCRSLDRLPAAVERAVQFEADMREQSKLPPTVAEPVHRPRVEQAKIVWDRGVQYAVCRYLNEYNVYRRAKIAVDGDEQAALDQAARMATIMSHK